MDLDAGDDDRLACSLNPALGFVHRFGKRFGVALGFATGEMVRLVRHDVDHVARQLDIDGPLVAGPQRRARGRFRGRRSWGSVKLGAGDADFFEDVELRVEIADLVVQQRIVIRSRNPGEPVITTTGDFSA